MVAKVKTQRAVQLRGDTNSRQFFYLFAGWFRGFYLAVNRRVEPLLFPARL